MKTRSRMKKRRQYNKKTAQSVTLSKALGEKGGQDKVVTKKSQSEIASSPEENNTQNQTAEGTFQVDCVLHGSKEPSEACNVTAAKDHAMKGDDRPRCDQGGKEEDKLDDGKIAEMSKDDRKEPEVKETTSPQVNKSRSEAKGAEPSTAVKQKLSKPGLTDTSPTSDSTQGKSEAPLESSRTTLPTVSGSLEEGEGNSSAIHQQSDDNATSSSSTSSKRTSRPPSRVSLAYLRSTRAQRRAVAKARTESRILLREEEQYRARIRELDGMDEEQKEKAMKIIEEERRAKEIARSRKVKRVKCRESVEKSRYRDFVLETNVESEGDALRCENKRIATLLEWMRKEDIMRKVETEVAAFLKKRKRGKE